MKRLLMSTVAIVVAIGNGPSLPAQTTALTFHDLAAMARWPFAGMQARGAMGQVGSLFIGDVPAGVRTTPHHHHQEQMMLGLAGAMQIPLAGTLYPVPKLTAVLAPANVRHGVVNDGGGAAIYVEFQPVLRPDWYPPHPRRQREGAPEALPIPEGRKVSENFAAGTSGWRLEGGARAKALTGNTASVTVWEVPSAATAIDVAGGPAAERFVYVVDGAVTITDGTVTREAGREMLVIVGPGAPAVRIRPSAQGATLAVFAANVP
jgi:mannose-6-phosphate isomerase-like protein (cupin superfamily)